MDAYLGRPHVVYGLEPQGLAEVNVSKYCTIYITMVQLRAVEISGSEVRAAEVRVIEARVREECAAEVFTSEIRADEVRHDARIFVPPTVPRDLPPLY
jgi:hypothetical protein